MKSKQRNTIRENRWAIVTVVYTIVMLWIAASVLFHSFWVIVWGLSSLGFVTLALILLVVVGFAVVIDPDLDREPPTDSR